MLLRGVRSRAEFGCADACRPPTRLVERPLRIPVDSVHAVRGTGIVPCGRVATGRVAPGQAVIIQPGNIRTTVRSVEMFHDNLKQVLAFLTLPRPTRR